jgi:2-amino-4-hydroxy-6-hydroxymethyldihydropteridine diphosphokinase
VNLVLLSFGGNIGDPVCSILKACETLQNKGLRELKLSHFYRTKPWGLTDQPDFINACAEAITDLTPHALLILTQQIEQEAGRQETGPRWGPRPLDIDILTYDDLECHDPHLTLPHPSLWNRAFVLVPLLDLDPYKIIQGYSVADAVRTIDVTGIVKLSV